MNETCPICIDKMSLNSNLVSLCGDHYMHLKCVGRVKSEYGTSYCEIDMNAALHNKCPVCRTSSTRKIHYAK